MTTEWQPNIASQIAEKLADGWQLMPDGSGLYKGSGEHVQYIPILRASQVFIVQPLPSPPAAGEPK